MTTPQQPDISHLSIEEQVFCRCYAETGSGGEAGRAAGWPHPRQAAARALRRETIADAIAELRGWMGHTHLAELAQATRQRTRTRAAALDRAWEIVEAMRVDDPEHARVALQALDRLARAEGWDSPSHRITEVRITLQAELADRVYTAAARLWGEAGARRLCAVLAGQPDPGEIDGGEARLLPGGGE